MLDIAIVNIEDPERANAFFRRGMAELKRKEDRETLARMYSGIRTRLHAREIPTRKTQRKTEPVSDA